MRLLTFISAALMLTLFACKKDDDCQLWQVANVTGNYTNTPDPSAGFHQITLPNGFVVPVPKKYTVGGSDNVIGTIDATKSTLTVSAVALNPKTGAFDLTMHIALYATNGDQIHLDGTGQAYTDNTGLSWQHYSSGTGKFAGITGWLNTSIVTDPTTGVHTVTGTGEATYKK